MGGPLHRRVRDCRRCCIGVPSDHFAVLLTLTMPASPRRRRLHATEPLRKIGWSKLRDPVMVEKFPAAVASCLPSLADAVASDLSLADSLSNSLLTAARTALSVPVEEECTWFTPVAATVMPLIATRNYLYHAHTRRPSPITAAQLFETRRKWSKCVKDEKIKWLVNRVCAVVEAPDLKQRWRMVQSLIGRQDPQISSAPANAFADAAGVVATSPAE